MRCYVPTTRHYDMNADMASEYESNHEPAFDAARLLLDRLGVAPEQLIRGERTQRPMPNFADYIHQVSKAVPSGALRVYSPYWKRIRNAWGHRRIDEPSALEITQFAQQVKASAMLRKNSRGGRSAAEHFVASMRCIYRHAEADNLLSESRNPARRVTKPRRVASTRRALPESALTEINHIAATTGNDPALDGILLRLHEETACRRGGALALLLADLDDEHCLVRLREKGETVRWQPVSPTLMAKLRSHAEHRRGTEPTPQLLRYQDGRPITRRRYDYLWDRLGKYLPWVAIQQVSTHWLRHTTLTWIERNFGYAIARAYAGHEAGTGADATVTYIRADIAELARALTILTGESHPLASSSGPASTTDTLTQPDDLLLD